MSLFRTKQFWSNQCSTDEEYDQNSLKVSRINSDSDFVLIGSHSGILRIFKPTGSAFGENAFYRPNDLYLESNLGDAILQIDVGRLVSFPDDGKCMFLVVAETNTLLLYQGTTLKWSAKLDFLPTAVGRAFFMDINGALVMLSENGYLQFAYLGSEPNVFSAPPLKNQEIDFEKIDDELTTLNKLVKTYQINNVNLTNLNAERELSINITIIPQIEYFTSDSNDEKPCCKVSVEISPNAIFEEVHLSVSVRKPLISIPSSEIYYNLTQTTSFNCFIYPSDSYFIPTLELKVIASFITDLGVPRVCSKGTTLPLRLVYESCQPLKDNKHKITLNLNETSVPLVELFPEFIGENSLSSSSNAIGLKYFTPDSPPVTILAAKSSKRYRLQSEDLVCLNLLVEEVVRRLKEYYANRKSFTITYSAQLPIDECVKCVKNHFEIVQEMTSLQDELNLLSSQYRLIQKRLITKFKQKNPTPLNNLDILLQKTYEDITNVITKLQDKKNCLQNSQIKLSCILNLLKMLINLMDENGKNMEMINATFLSQVCDYENQNWEDTVDAALCFLLRTILAKSEKDKLRAPHTNFEEVKEFSKLEKHFIQVLERISKAIPKFESNDEYKPAAEVSEVVDESKEIDAEINDIGTEFAAASTRALSARQSLLKRRYKTDV
ncbi:parathyroid hormone-responsive b1 [Holotrichia oblita]|uniref:Parathyroid hormone-responsive b1 n=1 Tax=Holotrichia oblita TaxID=644536 RepID=A0ACB9T2I0_HOLOL|nr:parathyroid hormone-responsive b1 [Holotrichia oblita]